MWLYLFYACLCQGSPFNIALMGHWDVFQVGTTVQKYCWTVEIVILNGRQRPLLDSKIAKPIPLLFIPMSSRLLQKKKIACLPDDRSMENFAWPMTIFAQADTFATIIFYFENLREASQCEILRISKHFSLLIQKVREEYVTWQKMWPNMIGSWLWTDNQCSFQANLSGLEPLIVRDYCVWCSFGA